MGGELEVFVDIDVTHRVQFEGTLSEVEVCISEQELEASESTCPGENSDTFAVCFEFPGISIHFLSLSTGNSKCETHHTHNYTGGTWCSSVHSGKNYS